MKGFRKQYGINWLNEEVVTYSNKQVFGAVVTKNILRNNLPPSDWYNAKELLYGRRLPHVLHRHCHGRNR